MTETAERRNRAYAPRMAPEQRREQLLDGVLDVIVDHGVHKVSIDTVARQVGVTRPVVYGLFSDSNQLLRASLDRENNAALAQIEQVLRLAETSEPTKRIPTLVGGFLDAVLEAPQRWRAILLADASTPAFRKRLERGRRALTDSIETLLRATPLAPDLDIEMAAHALQAFIYDSARLVLAEPNRFPPERVVAYSRRAFPWMMAAA